MTPACNMPDEASRNALRKVMAIDRRGEQLTSPVSSTVVAVTAPTPISSRGSMPITFFYSRDAGSP